MNNKISLTNRYLIIFVIVFCISVIGATYAYFSATSSNTTAIDGNAAMINLTLGVRRVLPQDDNNTNVIVPQIAGSALSTALKSSCVDSNRNVVCQVYKVTIKNNSTANVVLNGKIYFFGDQQLTQNIINYTPNLKWKLVEAVDESNISNSSLGNAAVNNATSSGGLFVSDLSLLSQQENSYYLIIWVNETNTGQSDDDSTFYGKVEFLAANGNGVTASFSNS